MKHWCGPECLNPCPAYQAQARLQAGRWRELRPHIAQVVVLCCGRSMIPTGRAIHPTLGELAQEHGCLHCDRRVVLEPKDCNLKETPEYQAYHRRVVEACVELMGEQAREFFDKQCDFIEQFAAGDEPEDVAVEERANL